VCLGAKAVHQVRGDRYLQAGQCGVGGGGRQAVGGGGDGGGGDGALEQLGGAGVVWQGRAGQGCASCA
jgi:hypothetical protein